MNILLGLESYNMGTTVGVGFHFKSLSTFKLPFLKKLFSTVVSYYVISKTCHGRFYRSVSWRKDGGREVDNGVLYVKARLSRLYKTCGAPHWANTMSTTTIAVLLSLVAVALTANPPQFTSRLSDADVDKILNNPRILNNYVKCVVDKGPCTAEGKELKSEYSILNKLGFVSIYQLFCIYFDLIGSNRLRITVSSLKLYY